jgi:hypothetical protein
VRAPAPRRPTAGAVRWWAVTGARLALGAARALACAAPLLVACGEKQGAPSAERAAPSAELGALGSGGGERHGRRTGRLGLTPRREGRRLRGSGTWREGL